MKRHNIKNKKTLLAIPLMAIAVIAVGFGMASNAFAQPVASTTVDQPDGPNDTGNTQSGDQTGSDAAEKQGVESPESSTGAADKDNLQQ
ncbi:MAG: hypothetical protein ACYDAJ_06175 [Nitrosotalea sp.]